MKDADWLFWERLEDMPAWEAEQECVMRREALAVRIGELITAQKTASKREAASLGAELHHTSGQLAKLNERIKYLRKLQTRMEWREAVKVLFGEDAMTQCIVYIEQRWQERHDVRRQWAATK